MAHVSQQKRRHWERQRLREGFRLDPRKYNQPRETRIDLAEATMGREAKQVVVRADEEPKD